ncbi:MAG TPA: hypothetical protein VL326_24260 [Kofleriaceae bacterium]|jgi:hypothetical protein|nr:hypothetical protein [Kofleriaceae bacterium]
MTRAVLISFGALVVIGGIVLAILVAKGEKSESNAATTTTTGQGGGGGGTSSPGQMTRTGPALPGGQVAVQNADPDHPRDYMVGDVHVRDHREGVQKPLDIPPNVHPAEGRTIPSTLTAAISSKVLDVLKGCAADLPKDARGTKPRLEGQIEISIKSGKTTINKAIVQPRDVSEGPAFDALKSCMEQKAIGVQNSAPDEDDLDAYTINISYAIP